MKGWEEQAMAELRDLGKDMALSSSPRCQLVGISEKQSHKALLPLNLPELASLGVGLKSKLLANMRTSTTELVFFPSLSKGCILWLVVRLAMQMGPHGDPRSPLTQKAAGFLQPILPPRTMATLTAVSGYGGQHWDFMDFESNHTPHSLAELVPWDRGKHITGEAATYKEIPPRRNIKSQGKARELKKTTCDSELPSGK